MVVQEQPHQLLVQVSHTQAEALVVGVVDLVILVALEDLAVVVKVEIVRLVLTEQQIQAVVLVVVMRPVRLMLEDTLEDLV
jgi:hypothetical protein